MNGKGTKDSDVIDDDEVEIDPEETVVLTEVDDDDDLSETVADLNLEELASVIENSNPEEIAKRRAARKRLEELREKLDEDDEFGSTYAFDLDEDLTT